MENKYYTPSIEEFHVGFEYQIYEDWDYLEERAWHDQKYGDNGADPERLCYVGGDMSRFRVKHLDKEDIESFGFVYDNNFEPIPYRENYNNGIIDHDSYMLEINTGVETHIYFLTQYNDNEIWIQHDIDCIIQGYIFKGNIKNKSELKRILKQSGII